MAPKLKPKWLGPFTVTAANYQRRNYSLDLSTELGLNLIYNTFHVNKLKSYTPNNDKEFPGRKLEKPGPVEDDRWEVKNVLEFILASRTEERQYKVRWLGYSLADDQWVSATHITSEILQEFWVKGSLQDTFKHRRTKKGKTGP